MNILDIDFVNEILDDIWGFHLTLLGIALAIFTLLYSFILSKRDFLIELNEIKSQSGDSPEMKKKSSNIIKYIELLKGVNDKLIAIIVANFLLFIFSWILQAIVPDGCRWHVFKIISFFVVSILTIVVLIYLVYLSFRVYNHYRKSTKI